MAAGGRCRAPSISLPVFRPLPYSAVAGPVTATDCSRKSALWLSANACSAEPGSWATSPDSDGPPGLSRKSLQKVLVSAPISMLLHVPSTARIYIYCCTSLADCDHLEGYVEELKSRAPQFCSPTFTTASAAALIYRTIRSPIIAYCAYSIDM